MNKISSIGNSPYPEIDEVEAHRVGANFAHCQVQSGPRLCASELQGDKAHKENISRYIWLSNINKLRPTKDALL